MEAGSTGRSKEEASNFDFDRAEDLVAEVREEEEEEEEGEEEEGVEEEEEGEEGEEGGRAGESRRGWAVCRR